MKHFLDSWETIEKSFEGQTIVLCLDYDGTLTPIMATPDEAILSQDNKHLLENLAKRCSLAIVSGRALDDVKAKVNLKNIMYIGNHGLEINGPQLHFESLTPPKEKETLDHLKNDLVKELSAVNGVWIEDKGLTLSVHYRLAQETDEPVIRKLFHKVCQHYILEKKIRVTEGKKVLEVRPFIDWDKGKALLWFLAKERQVHKKTKVVPIFIGDDITDEDALGVIAGQGFGVVVGSKGHSKAEYFLNDTTEVTEFMKRLLAFLSTQAPAER